MATASPEIPAARRWRVDAAIGAILALFLVLVTGDQAGRLLPFNLATRGADFSGWWYAGRSFLAGNHDYLPYHLPKLDEFYYPAPYIVLLLPFVLFSLDVTSDLARGVAAVGLVALVGGWAWTRSGGFRLAWLLALSLPVVTAVYLGQLPSTLGLVALSVAIWAQRRGSWWLVGLAAAVGGLRIANALPVITILVIGGWGQWRNLGRAVAAALVVLVPATVLISYWYPGWLVDYAGFVANYKYGLPALARQLVGTPGPLLLELLACGLAATWSRRDAGRPLDLDRAALALGLGAVLGPVSAPYAAAALIPAFIRLAMRPGMWAVIPVAVVVPWATVLSPFNGVLGADVLGPVAGFILALATIPMLLRQAPAQKREAA
jgi:hypothetical protein